MGRAGDGSTLNLDFTAMGSTLDSRITFSRADATALATFVNSSGIVTTVATAQAPRFDFDPTTLVAKGLLLEAAATNLVTNSGAMNNWTANRVTMTTPSVASPNGAATTVLVTGTAAVDNHNIANTNSISFTSQIYTFSVWLKAGTTNFAQLTFTNSIGFPTSTFVNVNLASGTLGSTGGTGATFSISTQYPGGWYRVTMTANQSSTTSHTGSAQIYLISSATSARAEAWNASSASVYVWGAQLEAGSAASSYIATTTASVTRAIDTAIIAAGAAFNSWYTGVTTGTFVANWYGDASTSTARSVIATSDQTTKHLHMYQTASALTLRLADFGAAATVTTANSLTADALTKGAFSYASTATSLCLNGGTVATGTLAFSAAPTWLSIGGPSTNGTSITDTTAMLNNSIRTLKYFPTRLTDGQIQGLTDLNLGTYTAEVLVVAGGGGGGGTTAGGGGGAGGVRYSASVTLTPSSLYTVVVGGGGAGGGSGADGTSGTGSQFDSISCSGGGGGGRYGFPGSNGLNGGSGGGGGASFSTGDQSTGGTGVSGEGSAGGRGNLGNNTGDPRRGGGGGGASGAGNNASGSGATANGGTGGNGTAYSISGSSVTYGGGGGGGGYGVGGNAAGGTGGGGSGGNDAGTNAVSGTANTGGGGGGDGFADGTNNGGSGVVIIAYAGAQRGSGGTVTSSGGNTIHTFTITGTDTYTG